MYPSSPPPKRPHSHRHRRRGVDYTDSLPDECLALIFNFLITTNDRNNSSLVSRRWLRIEAQTRTHLTLYTQSNIKLFIPSIFNRFNSLTQLVLRQGSGSINDNDMILITSMCPNLTCLKLDECRRITDSGMAVFSKNCKKLKEFSCDHCRFSDLGMFELLDNSSQLEVLSVTSLYSLPVVGASAKFRARLASNTLKVIELRNVNSAWLFEPLISGSKNLKSLKLICCGVKWDRALEMIREDSCLVEVHLEDVNVSDVGLISVAQNCRALKKLWIRDWNGSIEIGDEGLIAVGKHSANLQELSLLGVDASCVSLQVIATNCQNLVSLELSRINMITDVEMICVAEKCIALKNLRIEKCYGISNKVIEAFALGCPNLAEIEVIKCCEHSYQDRKFYLDRIIRSK